MKLKNFYQLSNESLKIYYYKNILTSIKIKKTIKDIYLLDMGVK